MRREDQLQKAVAQLLDYSGLVWNHSPNEGLRTPRQGAHAKAMGLKPGFPDVAVFNRFSTSNECGLLGDVWFHGLAIELKAPDAKGKRPKPTANQLSWHEKLTKCGWMVRVCYTIDEVRDLLTRCYPGKFSK